MEKQQTPIRKEKRPEKPDSFLLAFLLFFSFSFSFSLSQHENSVSARSLWQCKGKLQNAVNLSVAELLTATSCQAFRTQLDPFVAKLEKLGKAEFKFVDGQFPIKPPDGFEDYFGPAPWYRNIEFDGIDGLAKMVDKLRTMTDGESYEDTLRSLLGSGDMPFEQGTLQRTLDRIKQYLDEDPEIQVG